MCEEQCFIHVLTSSLLEHICSQWRMTLILYVLGHLLLSFTNGSFITGLCGVPVLQAETMFLNCILQLSDLASDSYIKSLAAFHVVVLIFLCNLMKISWQVVSTLPSLSFPSQVCSAAHSSNCLQLWLNHLLKIISQSPSLVPKAWPFSYCIVSKEVFVFMLK